MNAVASVTSKVKTGTPCADDAWRTGTDYDQERFRITRHYSDEYDASAIDRLITSGCYGVGRGRRLHLAGIGMLLADRNQLNEIHRGD